MTTNDETQNATETEAPETPAAPEAPAPEAPPKVEDPEEVRAAAREALAGLRDNPAAPEALQNLATISELVKDPTLEADLVAAAQAVVLSTLATPSLPVGSHAHLTVLFSHLLALGGEREAVDALYAEWIRHHDAFGAGHATPGNFQQEVFVQRAADLLGWGLLDGDADRVGIGRFAAWIDSWNPRNKFRVRRVLDMLHRNFPAGGAWRTVHFPSGGEGRPQGEHRGPRPPQGAPKPAQPAPPPAQPAAEGEGEGEGDDEGDDEGEGEAQPGATGSAQPGAAQPQGAGQGKRRRRRGGRKNRARREGAAPGASPEGAGNAGNAGNTASPEEDNRGNVKPPEPKYSDDDDDTQPPGI